MLIVGDDVDAAVRLEFERLCLDWNLARAAQAKRSDGAAAARVERYEQRIDALLDTWNEGRASGN
jgi:hypothetical protein